jgi:hypothetical protein
MKAMKPDWSGRTARNEHVGILSKAVRSRYWGFEPNPNTSFNHKQGDFSHG